MKIFGRGVRSGVWGLFLAGFVASAWAQTSTPATALEAVTPTGIVQTQSGPVQGKRVGDVDEFLGLPFAAPPVGDLRWRAPQRLAAKWSTTRQATAFGPTCAQVFTLGPFAAKSQSEDCLYLNVFTPQHRAPAAKLPVMVWIYGGGLFDGESNDYDGSKLARIGHVVVVTINYRLNVFGFLALPGLDKPGHAFGNYGLLDQQAALRWVQQNIAAFGGDPHNVTIFGQSSGAQSVLLNLVSPTAKGLFQKAIIESGSWLPRIVSVREAEQRGQHIATAAGCANGTPAQVVACLRRLPVAEIQARTMAFEGDIPPIVLDGHAITSHFFPAFRSGAFNHVPVLDGTNRDEFRFVEAIETHATGKVLTASEYPGLVARGAGQVPGLGANAKRVLAAYPLSAYPSPPIAYAAMVTDFFFNSACSALRLDTVFARSMPVYAYLFADEKAPSYFPPVPFPLGAYHTAELQFLFPDFRGATGVPHALTGAQAVLSDTMIRYWTNFARSGNPNGPGTPAWPQFEPQHGGDVQILDTPAPAPEPAATVRLAHKCGFWASLKRLPPNIQ